MHQVHLDDHLYQEAKERADAAGFKSIDEFIAKQLLHDFAQTQVSFDDWFTPEVNAYLDRVASEMETGKLLSLGEVEARLDKARSEWRKSLAS